MKAKLLFLIMTMYSCSHSIKVQTPSNKFLNAESQGKPLKGKVLLSTVNGTTTQLDLRNSQTNNPLKLSTDDTGFLDMALTGELGIWGPVDLVHVSGGRLGSDMTGVKVQVYGNKRNEAKKNNFSVALMGGYGKVINNVEEGDDLELVPVDDDTTSELTISNQTLGALVSYRPADNVVVSFSHYLVTHNFHGDLESQNATLNGQSVNYFGRGTNTTLGLQAEMDRFLVALEASYEKIKWDNTDESNVVYGNLGFGIVW